MIVNTAPFDVTGHPATSVPAGLVDGLPAGLMIIGRHFDDGTCLRVAHAFEQAVGGFPAPPVAVAVGRRVVNGVHDLGGTDGLGPVVVEENEPVWHAEWEKAAFGMFPFPFAAGFFGVDQFRYGIEQMHPAEYLASRYYEHWLHTAEHYTTAAGAIDPAEIERRTAYYLEHPDEPLPDTKNPELLAFVDAAVKNGVDPRRESDAAAKYAVGDRVRVTDDSPLGHTRKARYIRGKTGEVVLAHGTFVYPDSAGNGHGDDPQHVYTIRFDAAHLWGAGIGDPNASVYVDAVGALSRARWRPIMTSTESPPPVSGSFPRTEEEIAARVKAIESIMIEKGIMTTEAVDRFAEIYENEVGPQLGAAVVAKAWSDDAFRERLVANATAACAELGIGGLQGEDMIVVEDTDTVHNVIVCTLCSCYPWPVLGLPPNWYKYPAYRSRIVREPRAVLRDDFGYDVPDSVEIRVWDSSAELRYWVLPQRPAGTDGMTEAELAALVTRDSMIGVGRPASPGTPAP